MPSRSSGRRLAKAESQSPAAQTARENKIMGWVAALGIAAPLVILGANVLEDMDRAKQVTPEAGQSQEITAASHKLLQQVAELPLDPSGKFSKHVQHSPAEASELNVQVAYEDAGVVVRGNGYHFGATSKTHTPYADPVSFVIRYPIDGPAAASPVDELNEVVAADQLPTTLDYTREETRPLKYLDGTGTEVVHDRVDLTLDENGDLQSIRTGEQALQGEQAVIDHTKSTFETISNEFARVSGQ